MGPMDISNLDFGRILKWLVIVLITGFIAQFGKSFATYMIKKFQERKAPPATSQEGVPAGQELPLPTGHDAMKIEKEEPERDVASEEQKIQAKLRKKELKAQIKKGKKEADKEDKQDAE